ncbi:MAG: hypothetical protein C0515_06590 [Novosphingobium sp.]|nr:hypothetical protein [Novosphingobium sp.]
MLTADCQAFAADGQSAGAPAREPARFKLKLQLGEAPVLPKDESFFSVTIVDLDFDGLKDSKFDVAFFDGIAEFHSDEGLTGVYAKIGRQNDKDVRLKMLVHSESRSGLLEVFARRDGDWTDELQFSGQCIFSEQYRVSPPVRTASK